MKKNKINIDTEIDRYFNEDIYDKLSEDFSDIKMSLDLENRILNSTILKKPSFLERLKNVLDKEIEIPVPIMALSTLVVAIIIVNPFIVTQNMKKANDMMTASNVKVISLDGLGYVFLDESFKGGALIESKN